MYPPHLGMDLVVAQHMTRLLPPDDVRAALLEGRTWLQRADDAD
jgi:hypothetical protein